MRSSFYRKLLEIKIVKNAAFAFFLGATVALLGKVIASLAKLRAFFTSLLHQQMR